jgi:hypothetical protein
MVRQCERCESVESLLDLLHCTPGRRSDMDETRDSVSSLQVR